MERVWEKKEGGNKREEEKMDGQFLGKVGPKKFNAGADVEAGRRNRGEKLCAIWPPKNAQQMDQGSLGRSRSV